MTEDKGQGGSAWPWPRPAGLGGCGAAWGWGAAGTWDGAAQEAEHKGRKRARGLEQAANHLVLPCGIFTGIGAAAGRARKRLTSRRMTRAQGSLESYFALLCAVSWLREMQM